MNKPVKALILRTGVFFLLAVLAGCHERATAPEIAMQEICGRDDGTLPFMRDPLYRARIPASWQREDPSSIASLSDTTKALCTLHILDGNGRDIRITVHNFPITGDTVRIPPAAQVVRWQRQFSQIDPTTLTTSAQAFNGFSGVLFRATGMVRGVATAVMAWALQLAPQHDAALALRAERISKEAQRWQQRRADLTIKAVGPPDLVERHQQAIIAFARSVELIEGIPN